MISDNEKDKPKDWRLSLGDLIDVKEWQKIQDEFSVITDIGVRTIGASGNLFTRPSRESRLCDELLKNSGAKNVVCGPCLPTFLGGTGVVDRNLTFICRAGVYHFIAPLRIDDVVLGYILIGPVILVMRKSKEEYKAIAEELNIGLQEFWEALLEIKVASFQGMRAVTEFIKDVGEYNLTLAHRDRIAHIENAAAPEEYDLQKILDLLLDVAFEISSADIGSIMFADEKGDLTIRAAKGIPDEIVRRARVKLGEGISGSAAKEGRSFIIDNQFKDNRIAPYINRTAYISSSMIIPFKVGTTVIGVMNLGALKTSAVRFDISNLNLMNQLLHLVTTAIYSGASRIK